MDKIEKEKIRKKELTKLNKIFSTLTEDKQKLIENLKQQAAFMVATLTELQEIINNEGVVDLMEQGEQCILREHPAVKTYNSMIKNYTAVCKQLMELLPADKAKTASDELIEFVKKAKK